MRSKVPGVRPWLGASGWSEVALVEEGYGPIAPAFTVDEAEALVQRARRYVVLAGAQVHVIRTASTGDLDRRLQDGAAQPPSAAPRRNVQLGEISFKGVGPNGAPEAQHRDAVRSCPSEQHRRVTGGQHAPNPLRQPFGSWRRLVELAVEIVQELTDRLGIGRIRNANGQGRRSFLRCTDLRTTSHAQVLP